MVYLNNSLKKEDLFTGLCDFHSNENIYVLLYTCTSLVTPPPPPPTNIVNMVWHFRDNIIMIASQRIIDPCTCSNVNINPNVNTFFRTFFTTTLPSNL